MNIFELEEWNEEAIHFIIDNQMEESASLEFKAAGALRKGINEEICKDVSAFANSDGGLLIYGINEVENKAESISFIDGHAFTKEMLESIYVGGISRMIEGIKIFPIRFDNDITKTVYVVKIPVSYSAPHMVTKWKKYYCRSNFSAYEMEEYQVRQTYGRKENVQLDFDLVNITIMNESRYFSNDIFEYPDEATLNFDFVISIRNVGNTVATQYKLKAEAKYGGYNFMSFNKSNDYIETSNVLLISLSTNSVAPIYPNEALTAMRFTLKSEYVRGGREELSNNFPIDLYLYFNNIVLNKRVTLETYVNSLEKRKKRVKGQ